MAKSYVLIAAVVIELIIVLMTVNTFVPYSDRTIRIVIENQDN